MDTTRDSKPDILRNNKNALMLGPVIIGVLCIIAGAVMLSLYSQTTGYEIVIDYTDCVDWSRPTIKCNESLKVNGKCTCIIPRNITETMEAPVTIFYELDSYDQFIGNYSNSRDNEQLMGHLSMKPSESCGAYSYVNTSAGPKPIAPCGELADAKFNDTFSLVTNNTYVPDIRTGLLSEEDKKPYRNPPGNLEQAFKNFSKPINWARNVWELDTTNPENNGFQNEEFIAWMKTDLKRKPAWRVNHTAETEHGLHPAMYTLRVEYAYPTSRYAGARKVIISSVRITENSVLRGFGIFLVVAGLLLFIVAAAVKFYL